MVDHNSHSITGGESERLVTPALIHVALDVAVTPDRKQFLAGVEAGERVDIRHGDTGNGSLLGVCEQLARNVRDYVAEVVDNKDLAVDDLALDG